MSRHHPLFAQSHIPNLLFTAHCILELSMELKVSKNRSSRDVGSFKELNLTYTIFTYLA